MQMNEHNSDAENPRKRKWKKQKVDSLRRKRHHNASGIDNLPDDMLIAILSNMSLKDAVRASVLSARWRYLWKFTSRALEFYDTNPTTGAKMGSTEFEASVGRALKLNQYTGVERLIIRFPNKSEKTTPEAIEDWLLFAMQKDVKVLELDLSVSPSFRCRHEFLSIWGMIMESYANKLVVKFMSFRKALRYVGVFTSLKSLKLVDVSIDDEVVHYFLSCTCIEQLCIRASRSTKNLRVVDPLPNLKRLEISHCRNIRSLVISAMNLVSCTYQGKEIGFPFKENPSLTELTLDGPLCESFIYEPKNHSSYSFQLVKLVLKLQTGSFERTIAPPDSPRLYTLKRLELNIVSEVDRSLLFFISLIKSSPHLRELKIKIDYLVPFQPVFKYQIRKMMAFPEVNSIEESEFILEKLKVVEIVGYCGSASEEKLLLQLLKIAPSIEMVSICTDCDYYVREYPEDVDDFVFMYRLREDGLDRMEKAEKNKNRPVSQFEAKKHAEKLKTSFPSETKFVIT